MQLGIPETRTLVRNEPTYLYPTFVRPFQHRKVERRRSERREEQVSKSGFVIRKHTIGICAVLGFGSFRTHIHRLSGLALSASGVKPLLRTDIAAASGGLTQHIRSTGRHKSYAARREVKIRITK